MQHHLKEQLRNLFETHHTYTRFLTSKKCDPALREFVKSGNGDTLLEKVYNILNDNPPHDCAFCGKETKLIDATNGYRKYCDSKCKGAHQNAQSIADNLEKIQRHGDGKFAVHGYEPGKFHYMYDITNTTCGHRFKVTVLNLLKNENYCPECGNKDKYGQLSNRNLARQRPKEVIDSYNLYKNYVLTQTRRLYRQHKKKINPKNHPITRVDLHENAWNLDHIVPIIYCWENDIDADLCASLDNLRVMKARANISKNKKMTKEAQAILASWGA